MLKTYIESEYLPYVELSKIVKLYLIRSPKYLLQIDLISKIALLCDITCVLKTLLIRSQKKLPSIFPSLSELPAN